MPNESNNDEINHNGIITRPQTTIDVTLGASLLLANLGFAPISEFCLKISRRADICGINDKGEIAIIEVKSSLEDFKCDSKWHEYIEYCDRFYFAVNQDFPREIIPDEVGVIVADKYGGEIIRAAQFLKLSPARRKTVTLQFARQAAFKAKPIL